MADLSEIQFFLSGGSVGSGNIDVTKSTGGVITTTKIVSQLAVGAAAPSGITYGDAAGNTLGVGKLVYLYNAGLPTLQWQPPKGVIGDAVDVSVTGTYALQGASNTGILTVDIVASSLPGADTDDDVTITAQALKIFDTVTKAQALAGLIEYRCIYIKNTGTVADVDDKIDVEVFIAQNTPGADNITLGLATQAPKTGTGTPDTDYPVDTTS